MLENKDQYLICPCKFLKKYNKIFYMIDFYLYFKYQIKYFLIFNGWIIKMQNLVSVFQIVIRTFHGTNSNKALPRTIVAHVSLAMREKMQQHGNLHSFTFIPT